uniref:MLX-interacting protein-like isoform X2 n=1 Tax=Myxine glutinosa TaxID=7769 RepID=UPI00358FC238
MRGRSVSAEGLREEREKRQWGTADRSGEWRECQVAIKREPMVVYEAGVKTEGMAKPKAEIASGNLGENKKYNRYHKSDAVQSKFGGAEEEESAILGEVAEGVLGMEEEEEEYDDVESLSDANDAKRTSSEDHKAPIIHSGHFMVSRPHNERPGQRRRASTTFNHMALRTYRFGPGSRLSIDGSLTKLFECMSLAYSGGLVSPKWKTFKGLRLQWKDKIRLNNAIWRAWYLQYVKRQKNPVCHFMTPLEGTDDESRKMEVAEAVILEGKYWKKRFHFVIEEYHRWRTYFKKRVQRIKDDPYLSNLATEEGKGERVAIHPQTPPREEGESMDLPFDMDTLMSDFSDTLFSSLVPHASPWQHPRDIFAHTADMIQPALSQLQPTLEDFMDTMDPLQDFLSSGKFFVPALPPTNPAQISGEPQTDLIPTEEVCPLSPGAMLPPNAALSSGIRLVSSDPAFVSESSTQQPLPSDSGLSSLQSAQPSTMSRQSSSDVDQDILSQSRPVDVQGSADLEPSLSCFAAGLIPQSPTQDSSLQMPSFSIHTSPEHANKVHTSPRLVPSTYTRPLSNKTTNVPLGPPTRPSTKLGPSLAALVSRTLPLTTRSPNLVQTTPKLIPSLSSQANVASTMSSPGQPIGSHSLNFPTPHMAQNIIGSPDSSGFPLVQLPPLLAPRPAGPEASFVNPKAAATSPTVTFARATAKGQLRLVSSGPVGGWSGGQEGRGGSTIIESGCVGGGTGGSTVAVAMGEQAMSPALFSLLTQGQLLGQPFGKLVLAQLPASPSVVMPTCTLTAGLGDLSGRVLLSSSPVSSQSMAPSAAVATQIPSLTVRRQEMKSEPALQGGLEHRHSGPSPPPAFAPFVSVDSSPNVSLDWSKPEPPCKESGRMVPVTAEQKRRLNIHKGFSTLQNLVPVLHAHPNMKVSKATMLSKAAEYISKLQAERQAQAEEAARLRQQAAAFNLEISQCQAALPAGGVPLAGRRRASRMRQLLDDYVRSRTQQTWQFWLVSSTCSVFSHLLLFTLSLKPTHHLSFICLIHILNRVFTSFQYCCALFSTPLWRPFLGFVPMRSPRLRLPGWKLAAPCPA